MSIIYFGIMADDIYISEARFVVRSPERQSTSPLGVLLKGSGFTRSQDDSFTVQDFILSRDALRALDDKLDLRESFSGRGIFVGFPGLYLDKSFESLHRYYQKMVNVQIDTASSIATITVRAFSPGDAQNINESLLELSEALVNKLNERGRNDMVSFSLNEVLESEKRVKLAALSLAQYRNDKGVIDPEKQSMIPLQQIAKLQDELIFLKSQLAQLLLLSKENPQIPVFKTRIQVLQTEIDNEMGRVAGAGRSLATKAGEFHRLVLEKEFAEKQLASAMGSLELARSEAMRKQLYLERIVMPNLPDAAMEPRRMRNILATSLICIIVWGIAVLLIAGVKEHSD
jgi:capsular polysaccharide transport system permease protein